MSNVTNLRPIATTITLQQALATGASAASIRAVAEWNGRRIGNNPRYARQASELHRVADALEAGSHMARAA